MKHWHSWVARKQKQSVWFLLFNMKINYAHSSRAHPFRNTGQVEYRHILRVLELIRATLDNHVTYPLGHQYSCAHLSYDSLPCFTSRDPSDKLWHNLWISLKWPLGRHPGISVYYRQLASFLTMLCANKIVIIRRWPCFSRKSLSRFCYPLSCSSPLSGTNPSV